ncbi:MAG: hypothetical protein K6E99_02895 [Bacilli bacterium]|nr:hypothetical protein [Bacilli bacterium]
MKKLIEVLSKPRSIYFLIVAMFTLTLVLMKVSFSYYIPVSVDNASLTIPDIINVLSIDGYNNEIEFNPNETKELTFKVTSKNEIESSYVVFYEGENFSIENLTSVGSSINPLEENTFTIKVTNNLDDYNIIRFNIKSGFVGKDIDVEKNIIK